MHKRKRILSAKPHLKQNQKITKQAPDVGQGYTGSKTGDQGQGIEPWTHKKIVLQGQGFEPWTHKKIVLQGQVVEPWTNQKDCS